MVYFCLAEVVHKGSGLLPAQVTWLHRRQLLLHLSLLLLMFLHSPESLLDRRRMVDRRVVLGSVRVCSFKRIVFVNSGYADSGSCIHGLVLKRVLVLEWTVALE